MKKKVLVCDDDQDILDLVTLILEDHYEVIAEIDSAKVLDKVKVIQPDVILLDLWMPKITGDRLTSTIRETPGTGNTPVIVFSASRDGRNKALQAGANDFIAKPFDIDDLVNKISYFCTAAA